MSIYTCFRMIFVSRFLRFWWKFLGKRVRIVSVEDRLRKVVSLVRRCRVWSSCRIELEWSFECWGGAGRAGVGFYFSLLGRGFVIYCYRFLIEVYECEVCIVDVDVYGFRIQVLVVSSLFVVVGDRCRFLIQEVVILLEVFFLGVKG